MTRRYLLLALALLLCGCQGYSQGVRDERRRWVPVVHEFNVPGDRCHLRATGGWE